MSRHDAQANLHEAECIGAQDEAVNILLD